MAATYLIDLNTVVLPMSTSVYEGFDNSSIETVWKELRLIVIPHFSQGLCPLPHIHAANYFDFLNVYITFDQRTESLNEFGSRLLNKFKGVSLYQYAAKLGDVIHFSTRDVDKINHVAKISNRKMEGKPYFEYVIEGMKDNVIKSYYFKAEGLYESTFTLTLDDNIDIRINKSYPGLRNAKYVFVISKIHSANNVLIRTINGTVEDMREWSYYKVVPLAFEFLRLQLDDNGTIKSLSTIRQRDLENAIWMPTIARHSPDCTVLQTVCEGKRYNFMDQPSQYEVIGKSDEGYISANISLKIIWTLLRRHQKITEHLGDKYCPVPFLEDANFFDMFNVFSVTKKFIGDHYVREVTIYKYVAKLEEVLIPKTEETMTRITQAVEMFTNDSSIVGTPPGHLTSTRSQWRKNEDHAILSRFSSRLPMPKPLLKDDEIHINVKIHGNKYEIIVSVENLQFIGSKLMFTDKETGKSFLNLTHPGFKNVSDVVLITAVCVANNLRINTQCDTVKKTEQKWVLSGILPIGFQAKKLSLSQTGEIIKEQTIPTNLLLSQDSWHLDESPYPERCSVLQNYLNRHQHDEIDAGMD